MLQLLKQWGRFKKACPLCGHRMVLRLLAVTGPVNALAHSGMQLGFNCWTTSSLSESASGQSDLWHWHDIEVGFPHWKWKQAKFRTPSKQNNNKKQKQQIKIGLVTGPPPH